MKSHEFIGNLTWNQHRQHYDDAELFLQECRSQRMAAERAEGRSQIEHCAKWTNDESRKYGRESKRFALASITSYHYSIDALINIILIHFRKPEVKDQALHRLVWEPLRNRLKQLHEVCQVITEPLPMGSVPYQYIPELESFRHSYTHSKTHAVKFSGQIENIEVRQSSLSHQARIQTDLREYPFTKLYIDIRENDYLKAVRMKTITDEIISDLDNRFDSRLSLNTSSTGNNSFISSECRIHSSPDSDEVRLLKLIETPPRNMSIKRCSRLTIWVASVLARISGIFSGWKAT